MAGLVPFNRRRSDVMSAGFDSFQNMLDDFFAESWPFRRSLLGDTFKLDVQDNSTEYLIEAELPGVKKEDIGISLNEGRLNISVNKDETVEETNKNYLHKERRYTSMSRNIMLGDADAAGIKAKLDNGVLSISVPKKPKPDNSVVIDID
ncbi:HSP20 family protein [Sporobacter termitidis DSM 10068]|uniref:HSP20 family protein n=1 Tax=Sporobacter termitidis DSM 10068 TaxID=1123282 RepID=A0A1M5YGS7_9FIRM|nr:Hsp20/alpha crystallin family protein [Sporobacter termitidis]SHI11235.1 HSP20 family protein [Sporobacter termitidis DSM 10068]